MVRFEGRTRWAKGARVVVGVVGLAVLIAAIAIATPASSSGPSLEKLSRQVAALQSQVKALSTATASKKKKAKRGPAGPVGPAGPAGANGAPGATGQPGTPATVLFGCVLFDGSACSGVPNPGVVSSEKAGTGGYRITFDRDLTPCIALATVGMGTPNYATTDVDGSVVNVWVRSALDGSTSTDAPFRLAVFC